MGEPARWHQHVEEFVLDQIGDPPTRVLDLRRTSGKSLRVGARKDRVRAPVKTLTIVVILALLLAGCGGAQAHSDTQSQKTPQASKSENAVCGTGADTAGTGEKTPELPTVTIHASCGEVRVRVEVADDPAEQAKGLMYRKALGKNRGMLFIYPEERELSFWMKNTLIPLSIAFIDSERRIIDIQDMKPLDDRPPHYVSSEPAQYALEVNQGFFKKRGVKVGDRVELPQ
jgi:uncharacterized protein